VYRHDATAGIAEDALRTGAAVVPAFCVWDARSKMFKIIFSPALELRVSGNSEDDVREATQQMAARSSDVSGNTPTSGYGFNRRWKTRPQASRRSTLTRVVGGGCASFKRAA